ncbi:hypothetical protein BD779DRAFT_29503 [Infundibulicybe gibba]|nr:hypothetical protein BD779DRAFT_29503 [Infundibulicybe gibba]
MVWPFKMSHSLTFSKCIKTSPDAVLRFLHDPAMLFTLNPLIINTANDPSDTKRWTITDRLVLFGWIDTTTTYTAVISHQEDGLLTETQASAGTSLKSSWVVSGENDATLVVEQVTVQAFFFLMPLILGALKQSHLASLEKWHYVWSRPRVPQLVLIRRNEDHPDILYYDRHSLLIPTLLPPLKIQYTCTCARKSCACYDSESCLGGSIRFVSHFVK